MSRAFWSREKMIRLSTRQRCAKVICYLLSITAILAGGLELMGFIPPLPDVPPQAELAVRAFLGLFFIIAGAFYAYLSVALFRPMRTQTVDVRGSASQ